MNHGGTPDTSRAPIIDPADVPTTLSALAGSHPVSVARASSPPVNQAPPITPPAPSTSPTRGDPLRVIYRTKSMKLRPWPGARLRRRRIWVVLPFAALVVAQRRIARRRALVRSLDVELLVGRDLVRLQLFRLGVLFAFDHEWPLPVAGGGETVSSV